MTRETLSHYKGINAVVRKSQWITDYSKRLPLYINFDEEAIKTEADNEDDFLLTHLIRPCTKAEVMETVIRMLSM